MAGRIVRGEIRLYTFESPDKKRPVLVLTRDTALDYLSRVTVAPITSSIRGVPSEMILDQADGMKSPSAANFHNIMTVPKEKLGKRIGQLSPQRLQELCRSLRYSLGCEG